MSKRVTTQELAERLDNLGNRLEQMTNVVEALVESQNKTQVAAPQEPEAESPTIRVPEGYKATMEKKAQKHANTKSGDVVLYARNNLAGETKLAFCMADRYAGLKDRGLIGPVAYFSPSS